MLPPLHRTAADRLARIAAYSTINDTLYRTFFETMFDGFALVDVIYDDHGHPRNFRLVDVNPAFEHQNGPEEQVMFCRRLRCSYSQISPTSVVQERIGKTAITGTPAEFEEWFGPLGRWFKISVFAAARGGMRILFTDTTQRRSAEEALQEREPSCAAFSTVPE